ncbi:phenylacetate--CoA ligase family protein [Frankia sp. Cj3]|uniref:phenylacetate--CoA ligase family protein n=1 Tax=unclassified Frankia TaxID=2632575 RepID=UPI00351D8471
MPYIIFVSVGHRGGVAVPDDRYYQPAAETMPRADLEALQERRVVELVEYAYERSPFYRERWDAAGVHPRQVRTLADFRERIPFIDKQDVQEFRQRAGDPFAGLLCVDRKDLTSITSTSGTTSEPEFFPELWESVPPLVAGTARDLWELGLRPGDRVVIPPGTFRGFWDTLFQLLGLVPLYIDTWMGQWGNVLDAIEQYRPAYVQLLYPMVVELERLADTRDVRAALAPLKAASFAGMPLGRALTAKVRDEWGVNLYLYTSAGDTGTAWECSEHDGYHLWEDMVLAEHLDPSGGAEVADGAVGELVATDLDNTAAPFIRFRSGDLVRLTRAACGCGRTHARQWPVGRKGDETVVGDVLVGVQDVWDVLETLPETVDGIFQIIRPARVVDSLRLRVGYAPELTGDLADLRARVTDAVGAKVGVVPEVDLVPAADILSTSSSVAKFPRLVKA